MSSLKLQGATSGEITLTVPSVSGTNTLTLPANTGNIVTTGDSATVTQGMIGSGVAGTGPAFSATLSSNQSISHNTWTKIPYDTEEFDTDSDYDNATNYRYTPSVAGYYQVNAGGYIINTTGFTGTAIYKNGSFAKRGSSAAPSSSNSVQSINSALIYLNGSTDYLEVYVYQGSGSAKNLGGNSSQTYFQAHLVRAA